MNPNEFENLPNKRPAPNVDRLPPNDLPAEQALLGCVFLSPAISQAISDTKSANDCITEIQERAGTDEIFYDLRHQYVWSVCTYLKSKNVAVDIISTQAELKARGHLDQIGGIAYLSSLADTVPSVGNLSYYLDIVWEKFIARQLVWKATEEVAQVYETGQVTESFLVNVNDRHEKWKKLLERGAVSPKNLCRPADFGQEYYDAWFNRHEDTYGYHLPFKFPMRIRPSEMTLLTGDNGAGKSSLLGMISIVCGTQFTGDEKVVIASMEVPPEITLWIMSRQLLGEAKLEKTPENEKKIGAALAWMNKRVLLYNFLGITDWRELLNTFKYAREHHHGEIFIIDSVMRIGIPDDDYAQQGLAASSFADFVVKMGTHLFLVVHENKGDGRQKDKIRGSKQWSDNAHNVCAVKRNEPKAEKLEEKRQELAAGAITQEAFDKWVNDNKKTWDSKFVLNKQRFPGSQQNGSRWLYFDKESLQFHEQPNQGAYDFLL